MKFMSWVKLITLLIVAAEISSSVHPQQAKPLAPLESDDGRIDGTVYDEDGKPVNGATVYADPLGVDLGAMLPHAVTDEAGNFRIHIPRSWFAKFAVVAAKEAEDYPGMPFQFYDNGSFETVTLTPANPHATVRIHMGPKAGILEGKVTDALTGAPLRPCVEFRRSANPNNFLSGSGLVQQNYKLFVPSNTNVMVKIWLDGYRPWYFPGTFRKSERTEVRLRPGEHRTLDIALQPDAKYAKSGCPAPFGST
ncbi:MAG TPA: hypothetical protein VMI32_08990 [Candidatus Solibacter sp.]|nr:hypothetical protein [Candidatus Solibacter sp.]